MTSPQSSVVPPLSVPSPPALSLPRSAAAPTSASLPPPSAAPPPSSPPSSRPRPASGPGRPRRARPVWPLVVLGAACGLPELVFWLGDHGLFGLRPLRGLAYVLAAFRPDLLVTGRVLYPGQEIAMFLSYGFVHTGVLHLAGNLAGLWWLGRIVLRKRSAGAFMALYLVSAIGGAAVFAAIGPAWATMVGASGALFGLLGALSAENRVGRLRHLPAPLRVLVVAAVLVGFDQASHLVLGGPVAWQGHLGGFLTGAALALVWPLRRR